MDVRMINGPLKFLAGICFASLFACSMALADPVVLLSLQSGHSLLLRTDGLTRVAVGDGRIAGAVPVGTSQIVLNARTPGHTTVLVWSRSGRTQYELTVTEQQLDDLAQMLRTSIAEPNVQIVNFNHSIVVRGTVADGTHFQQVSDILSRFDKMATQSKYSVVNAVTLAHPLGDLRHQMAALPGATDIRVDPDGKGNVIVSGHVHDPVAEQLILDRARGMAGPYLASDGKLIDRLSTDMTSQVDVKVYVLEIDRTAASQLGVRLQAGTPNPNNLNEIDLGPPSFPIIETGRDVGKALTSGAFFRTVRLVPTIDLLLAEGHARLLSSPDLVTLPGNEATFLVGGELPIPFSTGLGQVSIVYKEFGVRLKVIPTLMGNGSVETKISPEVSDLDFQDGVQEGSFFIPALKTSRLSTDVVTQSGESIIMGGMLRRIEQRNITKIPLLSQIPILGKLFQSVNYQRNDSDVVFIMTPNIITR